mgnify:CR=1 FL=1
MQVQKKDIIQNDNMSLYKKLIRICLIRSMYKRGEYKVDSSKVAISMICNIAQQEPELSKTASDLNFVSAVKKPH